MLNPCSLCPPSSCSAQRQILAAASALPEASAKKNTKLTFDKRSHFILQIVMNSKLGGSSPRMGEGPEAPSSKSEIRRIRRRSRTIASASWSDCFSQWLRLSERRQKQRGRWGRGHEGGHGGGCRWWCRMMQDDVRLFTYRVTINDWPKVFLNCDSILGPDNFLCIWGAHQMWSIW